MWICTNTGFYSVVEDHADKSMLWVRARHPDHLKNLFPDDAKIEETPDRDYRYRTHATKDAVADLVAARIKNISYGNFKRSVEDKRLKQLYSEFWLACADYQDAVHEA
jgi:hypothetical protein